MTLADAVALLEAERDDLRARVAVVTGRERDIARRMYRRGYLAGRAAQRRGAPAITNPERHARTELREILHG
jgi:hypothetical protein